MTIRLNDAGKGTSQRRPLNTWREQGRMERIWRCCHLNKFGDVNDQELKDFVQDLRTFTGSYYAALEKTMNAEDASLASRMFQYLGTVEKQSYERGVALPIWKNRDRWMQLVTVLTIEPGLVN